MAADEQRREQIAARLVQLKNERPDVKQQQIADAAGVSLRAYQSWQAGDSGMRWENVEKVASFYGVSPEWLWSGVRGETPDPFGDEPQLERIERKLDLLLAHFEVDATREFVRELEEADQTTGQQGSGSASGGRAPRRQRRAR